MRRALTLLVGLTACHEHPPAHHAPETTTLVASIPAAAPEPSAAPSLAPAAPPAPAGPPAPLSPFVPPPPGPGPRLSALAGASTRVLHLHYPVEGEDHGDCVAHRWIDRPLPVGVEPLSYAMGALLAGPSAKEQKSGFRTPFGPGSTGGQPAPPMAKSFRGVRLAPGGVAIVRFDGAAMPQLNSAICAQTTIKSAIERTLLQFWEVKEIAYEVDGTIVVEWDA